MSDKKVIVITGATGVVGRQLVKRFQQEDCFELRVLSRNPNAVGEQLGDGVLVGGYEDQAGVISGADVVIHLAARNNDLSGTMDDFERDNCELPLGLANLAKSNGVKHFVFATSTKALNSKSGDLYGQSKAKAELELTAVADESFAVSLVRLCPVYGDGARGKVKHLQGLPLGLNRLALSILRSFLPIVSANKVADSIVQLVGSDDPLEELCIADNIPKLSLYFLFVFLVNLAFVIGVPTLLLIPVVISAIAVPLTSPGGMLFIQPRVGTKQKIFHCRKFRTMRQGTPSGGTHEIGKSYVTKVGTVLRKFKLDELPQAINVAAFEMNLIGPRPCLENQTELIEQRERYGVFQVTPGITGLGQCSGVDMSEPLRLSIFDHRYTVFRSILLDIKIAISTISGKGFGDPVGKGQA